ncbi:hypothetical protein BX616_003909 [Lobosporangium transversale]|nr:hypothetical protein BX616_003909 [Lobosporangium transversale]
MAVEEEIIEGSNNLRQKYSAEHSKAECSKAVGQQTNSQRNDYLMKRKDDNQEDVDDLSEVETLDQSDVETDEEIFNIPDEPFDSEPNLQEEEGTSYRATNESVTHESATRPQKKKKKKKKKKKTESALFESRGKASFIYKSDINLLVLNGYATLQSLRLPYRTWKLLIKCRQCLQELEPSLQIRSIDTKKASWFTNVSLTGKLLLFICDTSPIATAKHLPEK